MFAALINGCYKHESNETKSAEIEVSDIMIRQTQKVLSDFERTSMIDAAILEFSSNQKAG